MDRVRLKQDGRIAMRLPCENLKDYELGMKHHYAVEHGEYKVGGVVTLYNEYAECDFNIRYVMDFKENMVLNLEKIDESEHEREVHSNYYGMTNPLD